MRVAVRSTRRARNGARRSWSTSAPSRSCRKFWPLTKRSCRTEGEVRVMNNEAPRSGKRTEEPQEGTGSAPRADLVLLVVDDPVARLLTALALAERNWRVIEADGGAAALELFADNQPDVVVLDALMPEVDGFITCERLRRLTGGEHVPILMLTGLDDETSIARAYEAGATDFFGKSTRQWTLLSERLRYMRR